MKANPDIIFHLKETMQADLPARASVIMEKNERLEIFSKLWTTSGPELAAKIEGCPLVEVVLKAEG